MNKQQKIDWNILLHDIRSVQNVASIFRMAEVLGVNSIFLSGITPGPQDRFGFERVDFTKISLGTEKRVKWERVEENILDFISNFKSQKNKKKFENEPAEAACQGILKGEFTNFFEFDNVVIGLEQADNSVDYKKVEIDENKRYLIIPGREVEGLDENILKVCDVVAEIPQYGQKESLNIFSSMSIACFRFFDR
jgi:tRNA G18 (ribose-2'-O)-methylase SpoU